MWRYMALHYYGLCLTQCNRLRSPFLLTKGSRNFCSYQNYKPLGIIWVKESNTAKRLFICDRSYVEAFVPAEKQLIFKSLSKEYGPCVKGWRRNFGNKVNMCHIYQNVNAYNYTYRNSIFYKVGLVASCIRF